MYNPDTLTEYEMASIYKSEIDDNVPKLFLKRLYNTPDSVVVKMTERKRKADVWQEITAKRLDNHIRRVAEFLIKEHKIKRGTKVGIKMETSYDWILLDYAIWYCGAISVPIYNQSSVTQVQYVEQNSKIKITFSSENFKYREVLSKYKTVSANINKKIEKNLNSTKCDDVATICYTSGSEKLPKPIPLTHRNFTELIGNIIYDPNPNAPGTIINNQNTNLMLFLPLAHSLARMVSHAVIASEGVLSIYGNLRYLTNAIYNCKPTTILAVPRLLEKVLNGAKEKAGGGIKGKIFEMSVNLAIKNSKERGLTKPADILKYKLYEKLVYNALKKALGGRLECIISGGAALPKKIEWFYRGIGIDLCTGYGLTETTAPITISNVRDKNYTFGSVGRVVCGSKIKIKQDSGGNNEILLKGPGVSPFVVDSNGYFKSGDLGHIDVNGELFIDGRKKDIVLTTGGHNVSPAFWESQISSSNLIANAVVVGDGQKYIAALITLEQNVPKTQETIDAIIEEIKIVNSLIDANARVKRFVILDADFSIEDNTLTPSMKIVKKVVIKKYKRTIDNLYAKKIGYDVYR
jgi:long-chain acyl-CoA synthetase